MLESCEGERPDEVTIEVSHEVTSTDTDSGMSGQFLRFNLNILFIYEYYYHYGLFTSACLCIYAWLCFSMRFF